MTKKSYGRKCSKGCKVWPDSHDYLVCPICDRITQRFQGVRPITDEEALSAKRHAEFERYYASIEHDDGPLEPELEQKIAIWVKRDKDLADKPFRPPNLLVPKGVGAISKPSRGGSGKASHMPSV